MVINTSFPSAFTNFKLLPRLTTHEHRENAKRNTHSLTKYHMRSLCCCVFLFSFLAHLICLKETVLPHSRFCLCCFMFCFSLLFAVHSFWCWNICIRIARRIKNQSLYFTLASFVHSSYHGSHANMGKKILRLQWHRTQFDCRSLRSFPYPPEVLKSILKRCSDPVRLQCIVVTNLVPFGRYHSCASTANLEASL